MKRVIIIAAILSVVTAGVLRYATYRAADPAANYRTAVIKRGDLLSTIGATGTVEPEEVVDVGAQVMGSILEFGSDPKDPSRLIDYGSVVEKETVLARIDPALYLAQKKSAEAALASAKADLLQKTAQLGQTTADWERAQRLADTGGIQQAEYDQVKASYGVAEANVEVGKANIGAATANLETAQTNLNYTTIKSPVRGVIIDRRVNIGQTVVASLNAPSLFLIAKDLRRMQVWASVNEADIGRIHADMPVRFTVDAFPGETFRGKVSQIRLNATMTQNVVTYTVVVTTDNSNGRLLPYLTANVQFEVSKRTDVLLVPNAALRFKPQASQIDALAVTQNEQSALARDHGLVWTRRRVRSFAAGRSRRRHKRWNHDGDQRQ